MQDSINFEGKSTSKSSTCNNLECHTIHCSNESEDEMVDAEIDWEGELTCVLE